MNLFLIILAGTFLIALGVYWVKLLRESREYARAAALRRVADEKAAVRALAHTESYAIGHGAVAYMAVEQSVSRDRSSDVPHLRTLLERCGEAWGDWCEEPAADMVDFLTDACNARERMSETVNTQALEIKDLANRLLIEQGRARAEESKAMKAMDWGVDDSRWEPGTTAVDALVKERNNLIVKLPNAQACERALSKAFKSDPDTHALATAMPWIAVQSDGMRFASTHPITVAGDCWVLADDPLDQYPPHTARLCALGKVDPTGWRDSLLHYSQTTRTWEKPE